MNIQRTLSSGGALSNARAFVGANPLVHEPRRMRVMVVDDCPIQRFLFTEFVSTHASCDLVHTAVDGLAGMHAVAEHKPDVIMSDLHMPNATGLDLLRHVKREHPGVKVVIISGEADQSERQEAMDAGAHAVLGKPIGLAEFHAVIDSMRIKLESAQV